MPDVAALTGRAVTLDDETKHTYRRADSATLLGLLPELRRLSKRTQKEIEQVELSLRDDRTSDAAETGGAAIHPGRQGSPHEDEFVAHLFGYSKMLVERERWVRDELKRRGLIPLWPGEQAYLDEDA